MAKLWRSTSKTQGYKKQIYVQDIFKVVVPKKFVPKKIDDLFGDTFND